MNEIHRKIIEAWVSRAEAQGWKRRSSGYATKQLEFLLGAQTALIASEQATLPGMLLVMCSVGRDSAEFLKAPKAPSPLDMTAT